MAIAISSNCITLLYILQICVVQRVARGASTSHHTAWWAFLMVGRFALTSPAAPAFSADKSHSLRALHVAALAGCCALSAIRRGCAAWRVSESATVPST